MLTLQQLKDMAPDTIFASGITMIDHPWYGLGSYPEKVEVKWVAVRGGIHDWAIYHSFDTNLSAMWDKMATIPNQLIASDGAKLHNETLAKQLVKADDEAMVMYRH
jgi:hypothetical protein